MLLCLVHVVVNALAVVINHVLQLYQHSVPSLIDVLSIFGYGTTALKLDKEIPGDWKTHTLLFSPMVVN